MDAAVAKGPIELASEPPFALAGLEVRPATLEVVAPAGREQLEPRIMQVLVALSRKRGEVVSRDELIQLCWGGRIVGEHSINRCISRLHKLARTHGGFTLETVPKVGVRLVEEGGSAAPIRRRSWGPFAAVALAVLVVAAALAAWIWLRPAPVEREPRIALGAIEPLEGDAQTRGFAKRLTDEVAGVLNENVAGLAPPSPDGSQADADLRIGGSAQREGGVLRVRAYLEDGRAKVTLWSRQYERPVAQEDELRTQVAVDLSDNLLNAMEPLQQKGLKIDSRALALWVAATAVYRQGYTIGDGSVPARAYEQVIERSPKFANARGMMAQSLALASAGAPPAEATTLRRRARAEAEKALRIDPVTAEGAYDALFWLARLEAPGDFAKAEDVWIWGLSRAPNSVGGLMRRCELLMDLGRARTALSYCERAAALRPLGAPWGFRYARALAGTGQTERSEQAIAREVRLHPQHWWIRQARFRMQAFTGPPAEALALLHDPTQPPAFRDEEVDALESFLRARASGSQADADQAIAKLRANVERGRLSPAYLFKGLVSLGRVDEAYAFAFAGAKPKSFGMMQGAWLFDPGMEAVQRDPRFWPLAARLGLIRYWRTRGVWPDFCSEPGLPYDCAAEAARVSPPGGSRAGA